MRVLVTGARGQLGRTLLARQPNELELVGVDIDDVDIADEQQVSELVARVQPEVIVNAAAYTAVDLAESEESKARCVNVDGVRNLASSGVRVIHLSTDFVFDGAANAPYSPDVTPRPLSVYGKTKLDGEIALREQLPDRHVVLRTAWLYSRFGGNFVHTMLKLMRERDEIAVVSDQIGSPTWARSVADIIFAFVAKHEVYGTYHWTDSGQTSWYEFACAIQEEAIRLGQIDNRTKIRPISSDEYPVAARRPAFSVLDCSATSDILGLTATPWQQNLKAMLEATAT